MLSQDYVLRNNNILYTYLTKKDQTFRDDKRIMGIKDATIKYAKKFPHDSWRGGLRKWMTRLSLPISET